VTDGECANIEFKWWHDQGAGAAHQSILAQKEKSRKRIEQERYLKGLEAILDQGGKKIKDSKWKEEFLANI